ncbi:hypothetical protein BDB00DRAFT_813573 [Zychaea mexicana]|uniref:uncharacterized protein n=1 Tax=Zychaea mexicana TaxID=64656 RepID=UPI0022FE43B9|nr:uncharacterized protein BDB00DRAFT_813573 [Zychaea mexicana]KAI9495496.1 hypothetical protein BDB00DRAFT_813573 [Zychaea mexicana]
MRRETKDRKEKDNQEREKEKGDRPHRERPSTTEHRERKISTPLISYNAARLLL